MGFLGFLNLGPSINDFEEICPVMGQILGINKRARIASGRIVAVKFGGCTFSEPC